MNEESRPGKEKSKPVSEIIGDFAFKTGKLSISFLKPYAIFVVITMTPRFILEFGQKHNPAVYFISIVICYIYFFYFLWFFSRKNYFQRFDNRKLDGLLMPLSAITSLIFVGIACFAALTSFLSDRGYINIIPQPVKNDFSYLIDFYSWHFCDLIPEIDINETLNWKSGYMLADAPGRFILLSFRSIAVWIIISLFYKWNKWRKRKKVLSEQ